MMWCHCRVLSQALVIAGVEDGLGGVGAKNRVSVGVWIRGYRRDGVQSHPGGTASILCRR